MKLLKFLSLAVCFSAVVAGRCLAQEKVIDDFSDSTLRWKAAKNSAVALKAGEGGPGLAWDFQSDGATPYDNTIVLPLPADDWRGYSDLSFDFYSKEAVPGRIGCQVVANGLEVALPDANPMTVRGRWQRIKLMADERKSLKGGSWQTVKISLRERDLDKVTELRLFCDGREFPKGTHPFLIRNMRLEKEERKGGSLSAGGPETKNLLPKFSALTEKQKERIENSLASPPLKDRRNPYSVFMCYPMWGVKGGDGKPMLGSSPDGKSHPEWQETLVRDWSELGLTQLHFYVWPDGCGTPVRNYHISEDTKKGIRTFAELCRKYGIKIGLRVDPPYDMEKRENLPPNQDPTGDYWPAHPGNPQNELKPFFAWLVEVIELLDGNVEYVVLGDEIDASRRPRADGHGWDLTAFMKYTRQGADAIHEKYPEIKVSAPSFGAGSWNEILEMLDLGYAKFAGAVAINNDNYRMVGKFIDDLAKHSTGKKLMLISNGVGYIASNTNDRNPPQDVYRKYDDPDQAGMIARTMYSWWDADADVAPYYVSIRSFIFRGQKMPLWYGFFGFMDLHLDDADRSHVTHYPGWAAFQTIAQTFHDRRLFTNPVFEVESSNGKTLHLKAYERKGKELLIICWGEDIPGQTTNIYIPSSEYGYATHIDLLNKDSHSDIQTSREKSGIMLWNVPLGLSPAVIRLVPVREIDFK